MLAFLNIGAFEMLLFGVVALLLFGGELPQVARTWGRHFADLQRHLHGLREELNAAMYADDEPTRRLSHHPPSTIDATPRSVSVTGPPSYAASELPRDTAPGDIDAPSTSAPDASGPLASA